MPKRVTIYVATVMLAAIGAVVGLFAFGPATSWRTAALVGFLAAIGWVGRRLTYAVAASNVDGRAYYLVFPAAALVAADWTVPVAAGVTVILVDGLRKLEIRKVAFNAAAITLASAASIAAYRLAGGVSWVDDVHLAPLPIALLLIVSRLTNDLALTGVLALVRGTSVVATWKSVAGRTVVDDALTAPLVGFLAYTTVSWSYVPTLAVSASLIWVNRLYQTNRDLSQLSEELLELMVGTIEARDTYTSGHSRRVSRMAKAIARIHGLSERQIERVGMSGLLHDVGKVHEKYAEILRKPDRLSAAEWALMKEHPGDGEALVRKVSRLHDLLPAVRHHHERWDGTGYPDGLAGETIPLDARILAFADTIDAMTSTRPYRRGLTPDEVRAEIRRCAGKQFDPAIAQNLLDSPAWGSLFEEAETETARYGLSLVVDGQVRRVTPPFTRKAE